MRMVTVAASVAAAIALSPGWVRISWRQRGSVVEYAVKDDGIGIAPEHIPRLTERFYRVDRSRSRDTGGTGLGLAIVKHVVQRHGAVLRIDSALGTGSRFAITFPANRLRTPVPTGVMPARRDAVAAPSSATAATP